MAKLGFLGLGIMGGPMARHLVMGGHNVAVWSHNQKKAKELADSAGALFCATPAEVAQNSECAFLCVGDTAMSREVILGEKGLVKGAKKGYVIADCSTVSPLESSRIAQELEALGIEFLDAPCTGSKAGAEGGTLTFMIGGNMCCGINGQELIVRLDPRREDDALARPHARPMDFTGRRMRGFITVHPDGLTGSHLDRWVHEAAARAESLPPK